MSNVTIAGGTANLPVANSIDGSNDYIAIYTASALATQAITRNTYLGLGSAPAGLTDTQTLTNKTLTSPTISGPTFSGTLSGTYTIGGTPTFPSSVVTLTGTQTLTNKTLTSPTVSSPTITNATLSTDSITGFTTSNAGTIYGISVSGGQITNAAIASGTIGSTQIATNGVGASNLATNAIKLYGATVTSNTAVTSTTLAAFATPVTATFTVPSGGRDVLLIVSGSVSGATSGDGYSIGWYESSTLLGNISWTSPGNAFAVPIAWALRVPAPSAGSHTYNLYGGGAAGATTILAGTGSATGGTSGPFTVLVEAI